MELQLFPSKKTKITINIIDGIPHISIKLYLNADVMTLEQDIDYEIPETLEKISSTAKDYLKNENWIKNTYFQVVNSSANFFLKNKESKNQYKLLKLVLNDFGDNLSKSYSIF